MTSLRGTLAAVGAALGVAGLAAFAVMGCSGGETGGSSDGGDEFEASDGMTDQSVDSPGDATDGGGSDTSMQPDQGTDSPITPGDSGTDSGRDASDGGPLDAGDGGDGGIGSVEIAYANALVQAFCQNQLSCCAGGPDAATTGYNVAQCETDNAGVGWETNLPLTYGSFTSGHVSIDMTKASECIAAVKALPCGVQTAAQWGAVTTACTGVLTGTQATGSVGCLTSFECAPGNYCNPTGFDAGADAAAQGLCTALATQGQPCDTAIHSTSSTIPDYMCSYLGSGNTGLFCDLMNPDSGTYSTCQPLLTTTGATCTNPNLGTGYFDDQACANASGGPLCGDNGCGTSAAYPYAPFCNTYRLDGGTDQ